MTFDFQITRGDPLYREIPFVDQYGSTVDLSGWAIQIDFKKHFNDRKPYFSLTFDNGGLAYLNDAGSTGILCLFADCDQFDDLDLSVLPRNGERVPFKFLFGDVRMSPPSGFALVQGAGSRTAIVLKVLAGVTA